MLPRLWFRCRVGSLAQAGLKLRVQEWSALVAASTGEDGWRPVPKTPCSFMVVIYIYIICIYIYRERERENPRQ